MGGHHPRHHGRRQGARRRLPDGRVPRHRARRGADEGRLARLDLRRQSAGDGGRQRRARRAARRQFPPQGGPHRADTLAPPRRAGRELPQRLRRGPRRRHAARPALRGIEYRCHREAAGAGPADGRCRRERHSSAAAADHRRASCRRSRRHPRSGRAELCDMSRAKRQALRSVEAAGSPPRHFLDLDRIDAPELRHILDMGVAFKKGGRGGGRPLAGKTLAMLFEKPSTRTRVSFEVAMRQLGGDVIILDAAASQKGRGETVADTARVLSRYVDAIMMRTTHVSKLEEMAHYASVPVINGLTDSSHPCQLMADVMTLEEHRGPVQGKVVAWSGDGNNVAASWVHAAVRFDFDLRIACPDELRPPARLLEWAQAARGRVSVTVDPQQAARDADCLVTDTWVSMGAGASGNRHNMLEPYRVDERLMTCGNPSV